MIEQRTDISGYFCAFPANPPDGWLAGGLRELYVYIWPQLKSSKFLWILWILGHEVEFFCF